jgi:NAD(P)H-hydrate epimerase
MPPRSSLLPVTAVERLSFSFMPSVSRTPTDLPSLPPRPEAVSKRDFGRVVVVGGSVGMAGAPALSAMAALRSGAGLVELLVPEAVVSIAAGFDPCVMTRGLPATPEGIFGSGTSERVAARLEASTAFAIGPGIGRSPDIVSLVSLLWRDASIPAVFDADALWALGQCSSAELAIHAGPRVVTPHAGEMLRLVGRDPAGPDSRDRVVLTDLARQFATDTGAIVVLKGTGTLVVGNGREAVNETGNPGMATAGTGDVLTGVVAALLAQGMAPFDAARLAVWVHGAAGDAAAADLGQVSMTARDVLDRLHIGFRRVETARAT